MKGYLLDTSVALLGDHKSVTLSPRIRKAIEDGPAFLSVVAYWEVVIKSAKGTLEVPNPHQWFRQTLDALELQILLLRPEHLAAISTLPAFHRDPFDRALIAQAIAEDLTFLTTDAIIPKYASPEFRIIR